MHFPSKNRAALTIDHVRLLGGDVALDFVNTVEARSAKPIELLRDYRDLLTWAARVELIDERTATSLGRKARRAPEHQSNETWRSAPR